MLLHLSHCCSKGASRTIKLCNFSKEDDVHHHVVRKPLNRGGNKLMIRAPKNQCPVTPCVLNHKRWLVALRKQCIEETKEETAECEHFWPREWRHPKNTRNGLLRDLGCPCWELPLLGWIPVQNKSLRVMNAESDLTKQFVTYYVLCIHTAFFLRNKGLHSSNLFCFPTWCPWAPWKDSFMSLPTHTLSSDLI